jgi:transcriptional regulator with GAF, ATPase, and Fis domain
MYNRLDTEMYEGGGTFEDYSGMKLDEIGNISDTDFQKQLVKILESKGINIIGKPKIVKELCLP